MVGCLLEHALSFVVQIQVQPQHSTLPRAAPPSRRLDIHAPWDKMRGVCVL
jgi:hypothetical protein